MPIKRKTILLNQKRKTLIVQLNVMELKSLLHQSNVVTAVL